MAEEWDEFKFEIGKINSGALGTVRHIVHVPTARRIIEDGRIKAGLIFDESRLNRSRISVAWVSANTWSLGSIYGTVEFQFAWSDIIAGQKIYWVEAMAYRPKAYRLLLSKRTLQAGGPIRPYDLAKDGGPLQFKEGVYYWNAAFTSEFMIEDDLLLERCIGIDFIKHHGDYCRPFRNNCHDKNSQPTPEQTGGRILSFVLGHGLHVLDQQLKPQGSAQLRSDLDVGYDGLREFALDPRVQFGGSTIADDKCEDIVRGALALYGMDQVPQSRRLLGFLASYDSYLNALKWVVRSHFAEPGWEPKSF